MNLSKENYEKLKQYEDKLYTAAYCQFVRLSSRNDMLVIDEIYKNVFHTDKGIVGSCQHCVYLACKKLGLLYFQDKKEYEKKEKEAQNNPMDLIQPECATTLTKTEKTVTKKKNKKK